MQVVSKIYDAVAKRKWYSDVFVQGTLLIAALRIPIIVNLHSASGVIAIGLIVICMQYTGAGITE
jgi:hypothetical protein